jgi:ABC-type uncharacterized transport system ATPase subunit
MIEFEEVTKAYGTKLAVDRLTLHIEPGELFAFLGPNGAHEHQTDVLAAFPDFGNGPRCRL